MPLKRLALRISVSLMRTCHPGPVALKIAKACLSKRNETSSFVPLPKGRPGRTSLPFRYRSARSNHSSVSSGASSSGFSFDIKPFLFPFICFPHRNNMFRGISWRPNHNSQSIINPSKRNKSLLTIVKAQVLFGISITAEHFSRRSKIQASLLNRNLPLRLVP